MARPGSAGAYQSRKAGPGGGVLQVGRRPGLSGFGGPALDVGRCGLLQDSGIQARVRERAVPARPQRGPAGRTSTDPSLDCAANTASILATCRRCRWRYRRRKVKILEHAETMGDWPTRFERPWQDVTRQFWTRVTLCYISVPGGSLDNRSARGSFLQRANNRAGVNSR